MKTICLMFGVICFFTIGYCQIGIGTTSPDHSAVMDVSAKDGGLLIPRMTTIERNAIPSPVHALMIFNTDKGCIELNYGTATDINWNCVGTFSTSSVLSDCTVNGFQGTYSESVPLTVANTFSVTVTNNSFNTANISFSISDLTLNGISGISVSSVSPPSATLTSGQSIEVSYTLTGTPASSGVLTGEWQKLSLQCTEVTNVVTPAANFNLPGLGVVSSVVVPVDIQGVIDNAGNQITISVPYTSGIGSYNAYTGSYIPNRSGTGEGGDANGFRITYPSGQFGTEGNFDITLEVDGDASFNVAKQGLGIVDTIAVIDFPLNGTSQGNIVLLAIGGIPDRNFADPEHQFIYMPIAALDGNTWLNNNLGANYSNVNHVQYNPTQQATGVNDHHAYGSLYQWGRYSDGHELINQSGAVSGTSVYGTTSVLATTPSPGHNLFIPNNTGTRDWISPQDGSLWQGESGVNNPCPKGYRIPTNAEWSALIAAESITNGGTAFSSSLAISRPGYVNFGNGAVSGLGSGNYYWSSSITSTNAYRIFFATVGFFADPRSEGYPCRCIKD